MVCSAMFCLEVSRRRWVLKTCESVVVKAGSSAVVKAGSKVRIAFHETLGAGELCVETGFRVQDLGSRVQSLESRRLRAWRMNFPEDHSRPKPSLESGST